MGLSPVLPEIQPITIDTMVNNNGLNFYRPQTKFGARLYVYRCVSVHGGGCLVQGGAWSGGCLVPGGVPGLGCLLRGVSAPGGA